MSTLFYGFYCFVFLSLAFHLVRPIRSTTPLRPSSLNVNPNIVTKSETNPFSTFGSTRHWTTTQTQPLNIHTRDNQEPKNVRNITKCQVSQSVKKRDVPSRPHEVSTREKRRANRATQFHNMPSSPCVCVCVSCGLNYYP